MSWFDELKARMNVSGKSLSEELMKNTQYIMDETFAEPPTFKLVKHNNIDIPTRVVGVSSKNGWSKKDDDYRKVIFQDRSYNCKIGEYLQFDDEQWIAIDRKNIVGSSVTAEKCNNILTFLNSTQTPTTIPCIISNLTLYSDGLSVDRVSTMPDGKRSVVVSDNVDTSKFKIGQRFIFNHSDTSIFSISLIDNFTTPGLITLTMIQEQKQDGDDLVNNLAENVAQGQVNPVWHF